MLGPGAHHREDRDARADKEDNDHPETGWRVAGK